MSVRSRTVPAAAVATIAASPDDANYTTLPTFDELYRREWRYVAGVATRLLVQHADVRDVVQDVFVKAYRALSAVESPGALRGWLATITVRVVADRLRRKKWQEFLPFHEEQMEEIASADLSPHTMAEVSAAHASLKKLPVNERIAWSLRYIEQESLERVAELAGCSLATVKRRIAAAQTKLRRVYGDR